MALSRKLVKKSGFPVATAAAPAGPGAHPWARSRLHPGHEALLLEERHFVGGFCARSFEALAAASGWRLGVQMPPPCIQQLPRHPAPSGQTWIHPSCHPEGHV